MKRKSLRKKVNALGSTIINLFVLAYIASWIFGIDIWFISELTFVQFILIIVACEIIKKGIKTMVSVDESSYKHNNKWQRWDNSDAKRDEEDYQYNYREGAPPPPPPPNQSFSSYNAQNNKYDEKVNNDDNEDVKEELKGYYHDAKAYYKDYKEQYKDYKKQYKSQYKEAKREKVSHHVFIGDFKFKDHYWQLNPMELSAFIGDAEIDLTRAEIPLGETKIRMSSFIGDMRVHVPNDPRIGVKLIFTAFIGDGKLYEEKRGGFVMSSRIETPNYFECERKIIIELNTFIGDVKVKRVG